MGISSHTFSEFNRYLATVVEESQDPTKSIELLLPFTRSSDFREALQKVLARLKEGATLPDAFESSPDVFPQDYIALIRSGLDGNNLGGVLRQAASYHGLKHRLKRHFMRLSMIGGTYTIFMFLLAGITLVTGDMVFDLFKNLDIALPTPTKLLLSLSSRAFIILSICLVVLGIILLLIRLKKTRILPSRLSYYIPLWGRIQKSRDLAIFTQTLSMGLFAQRPLPECIDQAGLAVPNPYFSSLIHTMGEKIREGDDLSAILYYIPFIPQTLSWAVSIGESRGDLSPIFSTYSNIFRTQMERSFDVLFAMLPPVGLLVFGTIVFFLALSVLLPILKLFMSLGM